MLARKNQAIGFEPRHSPSNRTRNYSERLRSPPLPRRLRKKSWVREAVVAGKFYLADPQALRARCEISSVSAPAANSGSCLSRPPSGVCLFGKGRGNSFLGR